MGHNEPKESLAEMATFLVRFVANDEKSISIDEKVAQSEMMTGSRNASLAHFMASFERLENPVEKVLWKHIFITVQFR
ncbi:glutaminase [Paraglaciecola sp. Hal342]